MKWNYWNKMDVDLERALQEVVRTKFKAVCRKLLRGTEVNQETQSMQWVSRPRLEEGDHWN